MESALTGVGLLTTATGAGGLMLVLELRHPGAFDMSSPPGPRGAVKPLNVSIFSPAPQLTMLPGILNVLNGLKSFSAELGWLVGIRAGPDPPSSFLLLGPARPVMGALLEVMLALTGGGPVGMIPKLLSFPAAMAAKLVLVTGLVLEDITGPE